jgi:hypothetical protein
MTDRLTIYAFVYRAGKFIRRNLGEGNIRVEAQKADA